MLRRVVVSLLGLALLAGVGPAAAAPPGSPPGLDQREQAGAAGGGPPQVLVGAASRSVLPTVDDERAYLDAGLPPDSDGTDPGVLVEEWDAGRVAVGNGDDISHWVRDDLRVRATAVEDRRSRDIVVLVSADLYMIFNGDADQIRARAAELLPPGLADRTQITISTTHNHHGPDTAFDVNHEWYAQMTEQVAATIAEAVKDRRPATLRVGEGQHWFGVVDGRDPMIIDPTLNVLQATANTGEVIATLVQWNNHPESTLFWEPDADISEDCEALDLLEDCSAEGRYFTADFPGAMSRFIEDEVGGEALFFNGAVGGLTTPLGAPVWEVTDEVGLGNHYDPPEGAELPDGMDDFEARSFRKAIIIGEQLAMAALDVLDDGERVRDPDVRHEEQPFYTRMSHLGFRALSVVDEDTGRSDLGHNPFPLYHCPDLDDKTDATCEDDGFETVEDPLVGELRAGDHVRSSVGYLQIGTVGMMFLPAEVASELVIGLPDGFHEDSEPWFEGPLERHATGEDYEMPGYVRNRMDDDYRWTIGLGNDELGYAIPISDWRIACLGDDLVGEGTCAALHEAGVIDYADAVSGEQCKAVTEDPSLLPDQPEGAGQVIEASCRYGVLQGQPDDHYEETNSVGWDLAADIMAAVAELTGSSDDAQVNPDFPGYWQGLPPPAG